MNNENNLKELIDSLKEFTSTLNKINSTLNKLDERINVLENNTKYAKANNDLKDNLDLAYNEIMLGGKTSLVLKEIKKDDINIRVSCDIYLIENNTGNRCLKIYDWAEAKDENCCEIISKQNIHELSDCSLKSLYEQIELISDSYSNTLLIHLFDAHNDKCIFEEKDDIELAL